MKIKVISIGDELLYGNTINTNFSYICKKLSEKGLFVSSGETVSDENKIILEAFKKAYEDFDIVITTGGIGPTYDDKTKEVLEEFFNLKTYFDEELFEKISQNKKVDDLLKSQAKIFEDVQTIYNEIGSAPGFIIEREKKVFIILPGVPLEMKNMFDKVLEYFKKKKIIKRFKKCFQKSVTICLKRENEVEAFLNILREKDSDISIGIYPHFANMKVNFVLKSHSELSDEKALEKIENLKKLLEEKFKGFTFEEEDIEYALLKSFQKKKLTFSLAESCTGGAISAAITNIAGASSFFQGGLVSYSNEMKKNILNVKEKTLKDFGAVSKETVKEMAMGINNLAKTDFSLAISGIAGPSGGTMEKPVGTVFICIYDNIGSYLDVGKIFIQGTREYIINYSKNFALSLLFVKLNKQNFNFFNI